MTSTIEVRENTGHYGTATFATFKELKNPSVQKLVCEDDGPLSPNTMRNSSDT